MMMPLDPSAIIGQPVPPPFPFQQEQGGYSSNFVPPSSEPQIVYVSTLPEGAIDAEGAQALITSLEALRNEVTPLKHALAVAQQRSG